MQKREKNTYLKSGNYSSCQMSQHNKKDTVAKFSKWILFTFTEVM